MREEDIRKRREIRRKKNKRLKQIILILCILVLLIATGIVVAAVKFFSNDDKTSTVNKDIKPATITIGSGGDVIIHGPFYKNAKYQKNGDYDFSPCFDYVKRLYEKPDFMAINLETTLPGKSVGYSGYPLFKSPDSLADSLSAAGADLLLLANNHIYDSGINGFTRTSQILKEKEILYTGARHSETDKKYIVKDVNGIKVGIVNYTYETPRNDDIKGINGNPMDRSVAPYLNSFDPRDREAFYEEIHKIITAMKLEGAEFIVTYLHWGNEYKLKEEAWQREMAKELCDLGVDATIGSHPHVVQPVDVVSSTNGKHKMFCAYSLGNQLSNQRRNIMALTTGHTEDGLLINLEVTRDKKGEVSISDAEYIPTWVYKGAGPSYSIIPLDNIKNVEKETGIKGISDDAKASSDRTYNIIGNGIEKVKKAYGF